MSTVICLGEVLFDLLANQRGVSSEDVTDWTPLPGGAPANVACALVKMGDRSRFIGCVGNDPAGVKLADKLVAEGVDITGLQRHPTAPTRQVQVIRTIDGDRIFGGFGNIPTDSPQERLRQRFADAQLSEVSSELFMDADYLLLGTIALAYPHSAASTWKAVELAKIHGVKIFVDVNWRETFWDSTAIAIPQIRQLLLRADYIKFAREEAELIYGKTSPLELSYRLPDAVGIFVTDGGNTCEYWLNGVVGSQPAFAVNPVDTTGAGDAFVAGILHQLGAGIESGGEIVRYAAAAGALTTLEPGAIDSQPTAAEILKFLNVIEHI
jgi:fructokinase